MQLDRTKLPEHVKKLVADKLDENGKSRYTGRMLLCFSWSDGVCNQVEVDNRQVFRLTNGRDRHKI